VLLHSVHPPFLPHPAPAPTPPSVSLVLATDFRFKDSRFLTMIGLLSNLEIFGGKSRYVYLHFTVENYAKEC
jgi:hypothetical protein